MKRGFLTAVMLVALGAARADASNLVLNGSFESGVSGWTLGGTDGPGQGSGYDPVAIFYNQAVAYPNGAFGEAVPVNNAATNSPDAAGLRAAYFVSDFADNQSLSQLITVTEAGIYQIGFSAYAPLNGYNNANDAQFSGVIADVILANYSVKGGLATTWQTFNGATYLTAGTHTVNFVFDTNGYPAADVVIDQVYVVKGDPPISVPDGGTTAGLLALALAGVGAARRRYGR